MIIGIDAHTIGQKHTGNETYILNLLKAISELDPIDQYQIYLTVQGLATGWKSNNLNFTTSKIPADAWLRFAWGLPAKLRRHPVDLLHVQYAAPWGINCKIITTIHDISYIHLPQQLSTVERLRVEKLFPATARRSDRIITGSKATKSDIIEHFGIDEDKITVTPYGVSENYHPITDQRKLKEILKNLGLEIGYILYVGALQPRKNIVRLLKAFELLKKDRGIHEKLVIVGKKAWLYEDIFKTYDSLSCRDDIIILDYVQEAYLPYIYNGAKIFVYPSLYEGFGLPPLEAMACGTPVAVSKAPAMPEVVDNAGIYFNPKSVDSIAEAIHELLNDSRLRTTLSQRGQARAAIFKWRDTAKMTLDVYRQVLETD